MATAGDVAAAVLQVYARPMSAMKLQKLVYYCQAWHLAWEGTPMFPERIEAWAMGPVIVDLYRMHRGQYELDKWPSGSSNRLSQRELATVKSVVATYAPRSAQWLSELTHREVPWSEARGALAPGQGSNVVISTASLKKYYGALAARA